LEGYQQLTVQQKLTFFGQTVYVNTHRPEDTDVYKQIFQQCRESENEAKTECERLKTENEVMERKIVRKCHQEKLHGKELFSKQNR
jgi:hypothetical protein